MAQVQPPMRSSSTSPFTRMVLYATRCLCGALKGRLAQRARALVRAREPLVQACRVELVLAGLARKPRQRV
eukprot:7255030-Pyramimonas_sp.AAC.1